MQLRPDKLLLPDGRDISLAASLESAKGADDVKVDPKEGTVKIKNLSSAEQKEATLKLNTESTVRRATTTKAATPAAEAPKSN